MSAMLGIHELKLGPRPEKMGNLGLEKLGNLERLGSEPKSIRNLGPTSKKLELRNRASGKFETSAWIGPGSVKILADQQKIWWSLDH